MKTGELLQGIRDKLGTDSSERYTQERVFRALEEVINSVIFSSDEFFDGVEEMKKFEISKTEAEETIIELPDWYKTSLEYLTAGKILKNDQQETGNIVWAEGLEYLATAFACSTKKANEGNVLDWETESEYVL